MKSLTALAIAFALSVGAPAQAATVTFRLYAQTYGPGPGPNTYRLTAEVTGADTFGIAAYGVQLVGDPALGPGGSILTVSHNSLRGTDIESISPGGDPGPAGFTLLRSADDNNAAVGSAAISITGSQDTTDSSTHLIRGFGMDASNVAAKGLAGPFPEGNPWGNTGGWGGPGEFEIARGTLAAGPFASVINFHPTPTAVTGASVFTSANGIEVAPALVQRIKVMIPEPATFGMATLALVSLAAFRRRK